MSNGLAQDLIEIMALYINKVNELTHEFHYADPSTKIMINSIFNTNSGICSVIKPKDWKDLGTSHNELCWIYPEILTATSLGRYQVHDISNFHCTEGL